MLRSFLYGNKKAKYAENTRFYTPFVVKQAKSDSKQMPEDKNHDSGRSHSKKCLKTSICEIGNYFWVSPIFRIIELKNGI